jgi:2-polyprenyl-3-methyl-5-hydroxy-6-metoxy-1,4-benzoquinol methylase
MPSKQQLVALQETLYTSKNPTRRWLHCSRRDWIFNALQRYSSLSHQSALEVGPGSGLYLPTLSNLFNEVIACDIEKTYLEHASDLLPSYSNLQLLVDDMTASQQASKHFDLILCTEVIEHNTESDLMLAEMHRLLKPNGILILSTPQRYSPLELTAKIAFLPGIINIVRWIYREPILKTGHINLMTEKTVKQQLQTAGFSLLEQHKTGLYLPLIAELMGNTALRLEQWLENRIYQSRLDGLLWTQYYIAQSSPDSH